MREREDLRLDLSAVGVSETRSDMSNGRAQLTSSPPPPCRWTHVPLQPDGDPLVFVVLLVLSDRCPLDAEPSALLAEDDPDLPCLGPPSTTPSSGRAHRRHTPVPAQGDARMGRGAVRERRPPKRDLNRPGRGCRARRLRGRRRRTRGDRERDGHPERGGGRQAGCLTSGRENGWKQAPGLQGRGGECGGSKSSSAAGQRVIRRQRGAIGARGGEEGSPAEVKRDREGTPGWETRLGCQSLSLASRSR